jgi:mono/diheme cytochrome c family protein
MSVKKTIEYALVALVVVLIATFAGGVAFLRWAHGFSARDEPPGFEKLLARRLRTLAYPGDVRRLRNPVPASPEVMTHARAHFADHCAVCHGNDGRGQTEIGRNLYPRAPDMTLADTQEMSDGELFHVIKYGVRLTGMPAWGDPNSQEDDRSSWEIVHFIRHLPQITAEELEEMARLNPKGRAEFEEEEEERKFLEEEGTEPPSPKGHPH